MILLIPCLQLPSIQNYLTYTAHLCAEGLPFPLAMLSFYYIVCVCACVCHLVEDGDLGIALIPSGLVVRALTQRAMLLLVSGSISFLQAKQVALRSIHSLSCLVTS